MAQQVMELVAKSKDVSSIPKPAQWEERTNSFKLFFGSPHALHGMWVYTHTYTHTEHIHKLIKILNRFMIRNPKLIIHTSKEVNV